MGRFVARHVLASRTRRPDPLQVVGGFTRSAPSRSKKATPYGFFAFTYTSPAGGGAASDVGATACFAGSRDLLGIA